MSGVAEKLFAEKNDPRTYKRLVSVDDLIKFEDQYTPKIYKAICTQTGASELEYSEKYNSTGSDIIIEKTDNGTFTFTSSLPIFEIGKVGITVGVNYVIAGEEGPNYQWYIVNVNEIKLLSYATYGGLGGGLMSNVLVTIEIFS